MTIPVGRTFYLDPSLDEKLRTTATRRKVTQNDLVVEALAKFFDEEELREQDDIMDFEVDNGC